jgi:hypothetical protein
MTDSLIADLRRRAADGSLATDEGPEFAQTGTPPVDEQSILRAELILGRALPPLLRQAYGLVGNGGFGPGYGLLPLLPGGAASGAESVVGLYRAFCSTDPEDPAWCWPAHVVPFCDWGCAIRSCVDCSSPESAVITFDPNVRGVGEPMSSAFALTHSSLRAWFSDWIAGVNIWERMFEPDPASATTGTNPFTREPLTIVSTKLRRP